MFAVRGTQNLALSKVQCDCGAMTKSSSVSDVISQMCSEGIFTCNCIIPSVDWITCTTFNRGGVPMHVYTCPPDGITAPEEEGLAADRLCDLRLRSKEEVAPPCCYQLQTLDSIVHVLVSALVREMIILDRRDEHFLCKKPKAG